MSIRQLNDKIVSIDTKREGKKEENANERNVHDMSEKTKKYTNHNKEEIEEYLSIVKKQVNRGKYIVLNNGKRESNKKFIEEYRLNSNKQKQMILLLEVADFCYSVDNYNYPEERLYVFCKEYELDNWGIIEKVEVYIKITLKENNFVVIISFHKPEKKIKKLFK